MSRFYEGNITGVEAESTQVSSAGLLALGSIYLRDQDIEPYANMWWTVPKGAYAEGLVISYLGEVLKHKDFNITYRLIYW